MEDCFLAFCHTLEKINLPKVKKIGSEFLHYNETLMECFMPLVEEIGNDCLACNVSLQKISLPKVKKIGDDFLNFNEILTEFNAPNLPDEFIDKLPYHIKKILRPSEKEQVGLKKRSEDWKKVEKNEGGTSEKMDPEMAKKFKDKIIPQND